LHTLATIVGLPELIVPDAHLTGTNATVGAMRD
jgi:hypothetical protein